MSLGLLWGVCHIEPPCLKGSVCPAARDTVPGFSLAYSSLIETAQPIETDSARCQWEKPILEYGTYLSW